MAPPALECLNCGSTAAPLEQSVDAIPAYLRGPPCAPKVTENPALARLSRGARGRLLARQRRCLCHWQVDRRFEPVLSRDQRRGGVDVWLDKAPRAVGGLFPMPICQAPPRDEWPLTWAVSAGAVDPRLIAQGNVLEDSGEFERPSSGTVRPCSLRLISRAHLNTGNALRHWGDMTRRLALRQSLRALRAIAPHSISERCCPIWASTAAAEAIARAPAAAARLGRRRGSRRHLQSTVRLADAELSCTVPLHSADFAVGRSTSCSSCRGEPIRDPRACF